MSLNNTFQKSQKKKIKIMEKPEVFHKISFDKIDVDFVVAQKLKTLKHQKSID